MDWQIILKKAIKGERSQAAVARKLGYSSATVSQVNSNSYGGDTWRIEARVIEVFGEQYGNETVKCPVLGTISKGQCVQESKKEFSTASPFSVDLWDTCPDCEFNVGFGR